MTVTVSEVPGYVYDDRGLYIPANVMNKGRYLPHVFDNGGRSNVLGGRVVAHSDTLGTKLNYDDATGVPFWPAYASGLDDMLMRALVRGHMSNAAMTPVANTLLSTIVTKTQDMVGTWHSTVQGKVSPTNRMLDIMSRAQDSQFGASEFVRLYIGALLVDNRGAIGAQVPIDSIELSDWEQYGMELEPVAGQKGKETMFVLRMTNEAFRENQGLWMIDGLQCVPTGNSEYPYWIAKKKDKGTAWVLIHRDFGFQVRNEAGGKSSSYPGFGQSGTWRFSPYCVKFMSIDRQDWEHLINQPMRGIVWVSGLDHATQFREQLEKYQSEREEQQMYFYPGVFFGGSVGEKSNISMHPWSEPPAGYTASGWRTEWVDALAASFHLNVTHLEVRLGEGAMTQSDVASSLEAETSIAALKQKVEMVWNYVAPPRVIVRVTWMTDRTKRYQVESFRELSLGISRVQGKGIDIPDEEQTFTKAEIRALFEGYIGIEIPELDEDEEIASTQGGETAERLLPYSGESLFSLAEKIGPDKAYRSGRKVAFAGTAKTAIITDWRGNADWVWLVTKDGHQMLTNAANLVVIEQDKPKKRARAKTAVTAAFQPEGDPLEPVTEVELDPAQAQASAEETWAATVGDEDFEDLL